MDVLLTLQALLGCTILPEYSEYSLPLSEAAGWFVTVTFLRTEQVLRVRSHTAHHFHPSSPPSREMEVTVTLAFSFRLTYGFREVKSPSWGHTASH